MVLCFGGKRLLEFRLVMVGVDGAGKTALLYRMKTNEKRTTFPTIGFNVETVWKSAKNFVFTIWDVGGHEKIRDLWYYYFEDKDGIIFCVDSTDRERLAEAKRALHILLNEDALKHCLLCVVATKQDIEDHMTLQEIYEGLEMEKIKRENTIRPASSVWDDDRNGVLQVLDWFSENLRKKSSKEKKEERKQREQKIADEEQAVAAKQREIQDKAKERKKQASQRPTY